VLFRSRTRDDAAGEAYDKVAKLLGLGFPGGPAIEGLAERGNRSAFAFPLPMLDRADLDFSFSGLKTAVALAVGKLGPPPHPESTLADLAASFQAAVVDTLVGKTLRAVDRVGARALAVGGGVAANRGLRAGLAAGCEKRGIPLRVPSSRLCADNAAMIALVGSWMLQRGDPADADLDVVASLEESGLPMDGN
jgi:N6-L-threonylcarbamoyladenine synthase